MSRLFKRETKKVFCHRRLCARGERGENWRRKGGVWRCSREKQMQMSPREDVFHDLKFSSSCQQHWLMVITAFVIWRSAHCSGSHDSCQWTERTRWAVTRSLLNLAIRNSLLPWYSTILSTEWFRNYLCKALKDMVEYNDHYSKKIVILQVLAHKSKVKRNIVRNTGA